MTALPLPAALPAPLARPWHDAPGFAGLTVLLALGAIPFAAALGLDTRMIEDQSVWVKPLKFHLALAVFCATLAIFARWMPASAVGARWWAVFQRVVVFCVLAELAWISGAAALGTTSHFNIATPFWAALYSLMGVFAVTLTSPTLVMGVLIARNPDSGLAPALHLSVWLGLVLTFVLTVAAASAMASGTGHHVGVPVTGARLPLMGWSREVGDLRVAHFLATHALHALPLVGLVAMRLPEAAGRAAVWAAGAAWSALVAGSLAQAYAGRPFL
jgi:hypothetical protein